MKTNKVYVVTETSNIQAHIETWSNGLIVGVTADFNKALDIAMEYIEKEITGEYNFCYIDNEVFSTEGNKLEEIRTKLSKALYEEYNSVTFSNCVEEIEQYLWTVRITEIEMDKLYESEI